MRLVGDDDDIAAVGQNRIIGCAGFRRELLQGREDHAAGWAIQQFPQMVAVLGLKRGLAQQVLAHAEGREQLVVEIVAVGQHHQRRIFHRRMLDDLAGIKSHQQALARALRVPDHPDFAVAAGRRRRQRAGHRAAHGMELMIAGEDFDDIAPGVAEDDKILEDIEEMAAVEHALENRLKLRRSLGREIVAMDRPPGHEPFAVGGKRTDPRRDSVRCDQRRIGAEQGADLGLVGLQLVERAVDGRVFVAGVFQLDDGERQSIDEDHNVRAAVGFLLDDGELVHRQPVVGVGIVEIDQPDLLPADGPVLAPHFDRRALDHVAMQAAVFGDQQGRFGPQDLGQNFFACFRQKFWIQLVDRLAQTLGQNDVAIAGAFRMSPIGADLKAIGDGISKFLQPGERGFFDVAFDECAHDCAPPPPRTKRARSRRSIS